MYWEEVGLPGPGQLDLQRHPDRDPDGHGRAQRAVGRHGALHKVLENSTESPKSGLIL